MVICYNIHSMMHFDERLDWILSELGGRRWDLMVFTETWRDERVEVWRTEHGHTWLGSGGRKYQRGVGFLLHNRWKHLRFKPLSERVAVLDLRLRNDAVLRAVAVYFPHSARLDEEVELVYSISEDQCCEAKTKGYNTILAGDFNAEAGAYREYDDPKIVGPSFFHIGLLEVLGF